ncbi:sugar phosphate isomerase/epimerase family protein [Geochorda subterranea]|uniref:Sugar phosphate isomerase/epimerase n=1 Tax=Geochorda subterranea TaxID=3109564 RepID=A0ABZ1BLR9_9FIRM|nr:sugar phosphate isomerase/epimerase [Limnochorda sp. LNt]WRP13767.1 sugar phosphate isomerase/epimerase [Limnochorda sp. LNt]
MSTYLYNHLPLSAALSRLAAGGVSRVEIFGGEYTHWRPDEDPEQLRALVVERRLQVTGFHLPKEEIVLASEPKYRDALDRLKRGLRVASAVGASSAVLHAGYEVADSRYGARERLVEAVAELAAAADREHLDLLLENLPRFGPAVFGHSADELLSLVEQVASPRVGICFDTGHALVNGHDPSESLKRLFPLVKSIHLSDNHGPKPDNPFASDEHLAPGDGVLDWDAFFETLGALGYSGELVLEPGAQANMSEEVVLARSIAAVESHWRRLARKGTRLL